MGVTQTAISDWENGKREPNSKNIIKLADFFGVSIDYLFGRTEYKQKLVLTADDYADGYIDEPTPFEKLEDELRTAIYSLLESHSISNNQFSQSVQLIIEQDLEHLRS